MLIGAAMSAVACMPFPALQKPLSAPNIKIIWAGEVHGTDEQPALFADIVCEASTVRRPIVVALERSIGEQAAWDAFINSDGGSVSIGRLLKGMDWSSSEQDGRSSLAMLRLALKLRLYKSEGLINGVRLIIPDALPGVSPGDYEASMANNVQKIADLNGNGLILVLTGNVHARKEMMSVGEKKYSFAADTLPPGEIFSVLLSGGSGTAWLCSNDGCGIHEYGQGKPLHRSVVFDHIPAGYDAVVNLGGAITASPPAIQNIRK